MPGMDGIEATARRSRGAARVLVLTTFDLDEYVFGALRAGAAGFLLKDASRERWSRRSGSSTPARRCSRRRSPAA